MKRALGRIFPRLRDFWRLRRSYRAKFGYFPRVAFAKTFNEKLWRRKFLIAIRACHCAPTSCWSKLLSPKNLALAGSRQHYGTARRCRPCTKGSGRDLCAEGQSRQRLEYFCSISKRSRLAADRGVVRYMAQLNLTVS